MKVLYFDTETTGLDPFKNDIIQIAGMIEVDGKVVEEFNIKCQPYSYDNVDQKALDVHKMTVDMIKQYPSSYAGYYEFQNVLSRHCDKFNKADKYYVSGYNVRFDLDFLSQFFKKHMDDYLGSFINWKVIDPLNLIHFLDLEGKISGFDNYKLETMANHFGIQIDAHDALSDVKATKAVYEKLKELYFK